MFWPILVCSIVTAGLWIARQFAPETLSPYADALAILIIVLMFIGLVRRAMGRARRATLRSLATGLVSDLDTRPVEPVTRDHR